MTTTLDRSNVNQECLGLNFGFRVWGLPLLDTCRALVQAIPRVAEVYGEHVFEIRIWRVFNIRESDALMRNFMQ